MNMVDNPDEQCGRYALPGHGATEAQNFEEAKLSSWLDVLLLHWHI